MGKTYSKKIKDNYPQLLSIVSKIFSIDEDLINSSTRKREVVIARGALFLAAYNLNFHDSLWDTCESLGLHHSTFIHHKNILRDDLEWFAKKGISNPLLVAYRQVILSPEYMRYCESLTQLQQSNFKKVELYDYYKKTENNL